MENHLNYLDKSLNDTWDLLPTEEPIEDFDKDVLLSTIMLKGGQFEPLYTDPEYYYWSTGMWWRKWRRNFTKWAEVLQMQYNPIENYDRNEITHDDTVDVGSMNQLTKNKEVIDDDTTKNYTLDGTKNYENDGTTSNNEVVDQDGTLNRTNNFDKTTTNDGTSTNTQIIGENGSKTGNIKEVMNDEINKTTNNTEVIDGDGTKEVTTSDVENVNNNGGYSNNITVAGFNSASLEPKSGESNKHNDDTETNKRGNLGETTTNDVTTTNDGTEDTTEERTTTTDTTENTKLDRTTTDNGTTHNDGTEKSKDITDETTTLDRTTDNNGTSHDEGSETSNDTYAETGTDDRITTNDGSLDQTTNNDRDYDRKSHIWGNIGVTTSQQMIESELKLRRWNLYEQIADIFMDEMCVRVY